MTITRKQALILATLSTYVGNPTARRLTDRLDRPDANSRRFTYDEVYSLLRRLEHNGHVRRIEGHAWGWAATDEGLAALMAFHD